MRIAFLTTEFMTEPIFSGGLSNYLLRTCLALRDFGHEPVIFVSSHVDQVLKYRGIVVHRLKIYTPLLIKIIDRLTFRMLLRPLSLISWSFAFEKTIERLYSDNRFDIIQATNCRAILLCIKKKTPLVIRLSHFEPLWRKHYETSYSISQIIIERLETMALKRADAIFAPSKLLANTIKRELNLTVKIIEPPFVLDIYQLDWTIYNKTLNRKSYLLFFGTIGLLKGCKTIAQILEPLLLDHPDLYFVFAGKDTEYKGHSMLSFIMKSAGMVRDRVIHLNDLSHSELYPIVKNAVGVVLPSRVDNLPNTCIEAMYFGQIVVGTLGASFEQIIEDGKSGFLCLPDNTDSLSKAINRVLSLSEENRKFFSENAKKRIEQLLPQKVIKELIEYYQEAIEKVRML